MEYHGFKALSLPAVFVKWFCGGVLGRVFGKSDAAFKCCVFTDIIFIYTPSLPPPHSEQCYFPLGIANYAAQA